MEAENKKDQTLEDVFEQLDEVVKKLENEKPGSRFTDTLTFKVTSLSGDGLTQVK